ncbi:MULTISPECIES: hypothetical protein [Vibrio]|uniref:hypothetical protein n=1 Tax=Vibrio TaxID=662 RepID=UPI0021D31C1B|nr:MULTISPECIES: hypothetical protein [Vibrio]MDF4592530.1 hypothetical protein [Vibrio parahaemolyticus]MCR9846727.1 hypothetical protein [Vibrio antiquarius]MCR9912322.1 hypothetical protein [Vibrio antiquarius]MDW1603332.1 hypothetical protein [Vibrio sp. Vb2977]MDW1667210.1 hypothetical protein [Vibrio sp. Vb2978]
MEKEWFDLADTTVKIGLGAIISVFGAYKLSALNHKRDIDKKMIEKKIDIIEEISENAEIYFYFCTSLYNTVGGMLLDSDNLGQELTESQKKVVISKHENFNRALEHRNKAFSKIKILAIPGAEDALLEYNGALKDFRRMIVFDGQAPTDEFLKQVLERFTKHKGKFYETLNQYMNNFGK